MSRTSVPTHSGCRCVADSNTGFHEPCRVTRLRKPGWRHGPQGLQSVLSCTRSSRFPPKTGGSSPLIANDGARTHLRSQLHSYEPPGSRAGIAAECECPFPEISASGLSTLAMIESAVGVFSFEVRFRSESPGRRHVACKRRHFGQFRRVGEPLVRESEVGARLQRGTLRPTIG